MSWARGHDPFEILDRCHASVWQTHVSPSDSPRARLSADLKWSYHKGETTARRSQVLKAMMAGDQAQVQFQGPRVSVCRTSSLPRDTPPPPPLPELCLLPLYTDSWPWVQQAALPFAWPSPGFTVLIQFISLRDTRLAPRVRAPCPCIMPHAPMPFSCPLAAYIKRICLQLTPLMCALSRSQLNMALK